MKDFVLYAQLIMLFTNIFVFVLLMQESNKYKFAKVGLLIAISLGTIINLGKLTWLNVLFSLTPFILLGKIFKTKNEHQKTVV